MSLGVYSLCHSNRLTSITLSGKIVKPDIKAGSKFHPYCQFSGVIISLNAKSLACNWFNCIPPDLPPMPSPAEPALGWQFLEHPQVSPMGGISTAAGDPAACTKTLPLRFGDRKLLAFVTIFMPWTA